MEGQRVPEVPILPALFLSILVFLPISTCSLDTPKLGLNCTTQTSSCGRIRNISYPFHLKDDQNNCTNSSYELTCQGNRTILYISSMKYYVENISYENQTLRLVDGDLASSKCPISGNSLSRENINLRLFLTNPTNVAFITCSVLIEDKNYSPLNCTSKSQGFHYLRVGSNLINDLPSKCRCYAMVPVINWELPDDRSFAAVQKLLQMGFELSWSESKSQTEYMPNYSYYYSFESPIMVHAIVYGFFVRTSLGVLHLFAVIIFVIYRKFRSNYAKNGIPQSHESLGPTRYSYANIKKMTDNFKQKLGQGGYGSVFKGRLPNGQLVAVKMLDSSKGNGEEFINEVATIGRIHHVNVVKLVGFFLEGSRSALVYEFMPNGSLDKYIFYSDNRSQRISWEKLYEIALGVAHGIGYLHRGCDMCILHFDIKPHNILLDENFNPKVSDFGLAKLFSTDHSVVSISNARGTAGYIAPELFSSNFGGVSYKSDVYSFGMLLLEMAGRRKNFSPLVERVSQIYFPTWVYDQLALGEDLEIGTATKGEGDIAKKLVIIGLWCIQMTPNDRPSMSRVVEMLEENSGDLEMPPKPFLASPERLPIEESSLTESDTKALLVQYEMD